MKKLSKVLPASFALGLLLVSCKPKELVFTIEGQIFDESYNQLADGGTIKLYRVPVATTNEVFIQEKSITNGTYSFTFPRDKSERYVLRFSKPDYFDEVKEVYFSQLTVGESYVLNFTTEAESTVHWIFIDDLPQNPNYSATVQKLNGRATGLGTCPNQAYEYFGGFAPDTLRCAVGGNKYVKFYVLRPPNALLDSVFCPAFGNVYYTVNF